MSQLLAIEVPPEVIEAARAGESVAHETIYRCCQRPVYTLIRRLIPRAAIADELFQETFVEILRSIRTYTGEGSFGGWVRAIAVNKCLAYLRSPWHRSLLRLDPDGSEPAPVMLLEPGSGPEAQTQASADLERALASLPPLTRTVVWLHDVEGYTHTEIGRLLGRTTSFSKSQLSRAHERLRELLDDPSESLSCTHVSTIC
ncbi:MAG TPA: RNA polymerase sigma factor [Steroidobacteraceae bacterium]|jgi:RNA polymerase sigma-70 factor (ECF subfamily)